MLVLIEARYPVKSGSAELVSRIHVIASGIRSSCMLAPIRRFYRRVGNTEETFRGSWTERNGEILQFSSDVPRDAFVGSTKESWKSVIVLIDHGLLDSTSTSLTKEHTYIYIYILERVASIRFLLASYRLIVIEIDYWSSSFRGGEEAFKGKEDACFERAIKKLPRSKVIRGVDNGPYIAA